MMLQYKNADVIPHRCVGWLVKRWVYLRGTSRTTLIQFRFASQRSSDLLGGPGYLLSHRASFRKLSEQSRGHYRYPSKGNHPSDSEEYTGQACDTCPQDDQERRDHTGCGTVDPPFPSSLGQEPADENETVHDQRKKRRVKEDAVQHSVPAHSGRHACRSTRRETQTWIGVEDATY